MLMKFTIIAGCLSFLVCGSGLAEAPETQQPATTAFVAVNVVPMDSDRVLPRQTVLVRDRKTVAMGPSITIPAGAQVIDGGGSGFLSPGLADMHTHSDTSEDMKVYLANGVTTVLNMGNASMEFIGQVRPLINEGKRPGPHIYTAFRIDGSIRAVRGQECR